MYRMLFLALMAGCAGQGPEKEAAENEHAMHSISTESNMYADSVNNGLIEDTMQGSPHRIAMATINGTHVHIEYGSPGTKGRVIWGGLVAYDKVWVTGAHQATSIQFRKPVMIGGKIIPAGMYAIFTIPGQSEWTVIFNKDYDQHLADDYTEQQDLVRIRVRPMGRPMLQRLTYEVKRAGADGGIITMSWEKLSIQIPFKTKTG